MPRIVFGSRNTDASHAFPRRTVDYITVTTTGNAVDRDDIDDYYGGSAASSNGTVGVQTGGNLPTGNAYPNNYSTSMQKMRKITIDTGNATETGDMGLKLFTIGAAGDATRGCLQVVLIDLITKVDLLFLLLLSNIFLCNCKFCLSIR